MRREVNKTSVFSEYEKNQNDSISSRQLEYWLKNAGPSSQPKFGGLQWTLMSTNSVFEQEQHALLRNQTFQSLHKENDPSAFNSARPSSYNSSGGMKSKSYVNAMLDLQQKVKSLETENQKLKVMAHGLKEENAKTMRDSTHVKEEMQHRLGILEPKTKRTEQLVRQNKMLRDTRDENMRKVKLVDRVVKDSQFKLAQYERESQKMRTELQISNEKIFDMARQQEEKDKQLQKTKQILGKLQVKNKELESLKERSNSSMIEKCHKSADMVEQLSHEKMNLKQEISYLKEKGEETVRELQVKSRNDREEYLMVIERIKQQLLEKKQVIKSLTDQGAYFKEKYEETNNQLKVILKNHAQEILKMKECHQNEVRTLRNQPKQKEIVYIQKIVQKKRPEMIMDLNKQSQIKENQQIAQQIQSQLQFEEFQSNEEQEEQIEEILPQETRSLEKDVYRHSSIKPTKFKPSDCHSYQHKKVEKKIGQKSSAKRRGSILNTKSKRSSNEKVSSQKRQRSRQKYEEKSLEKGTPFDHEPSFILKSCEPIVKHHQQGEHFMYTKDPIIYSSANHPTTRQKVPYYWEPNEVAEFANSQRGSGQADPYVIEKALLNEVNKEAIRLIGDQEKYMVLMEQSQNETEKSENIGRMRQVNEQMKLNAERMIELKSKIASV